MFFTPFIFTKSNNQKKQKVYYVYHLKPTNAKNS